MGPRFVDTTRQRGPSDRGEARRAPVVVLAHHPRLARVGERLVLDTVTEVSRLAPAWRDDGGRDTAPLDDPFLSRRPIAIRRLARGGIEIDNPHGVGLAIGGAELPAGKLRRLSDAELDRGVDLVLGGRVVLWLGTGDPDDGADDLGLFGRSAAMCALRARVRAAAAGGEPVLITGETGAGKELVARALHAHGPRAAGPLVVVNVAAIPAAVAAAELFGHERGAFTGAGERRAGYLERAAGGVLFLDEIGELPEAIQPVLLRALESGEIQPIGGQPRRVDVRVIAATDANLATAAAAGRFRGPLYHRLAAIEITVPPLRDRGADIARLLARFLGDAVPAELADQTTAATPWLPAPVVGALLRRGWPGNVRELRNAAHRLAAAARAGQIASLDELGPDLAEEPAVEPSSSSPGTAAIDDDRLVAALRAHRFQLNRTAEDLGISRTHLDALIARNPRLRKAKDLDPAEITAAAAAHDNDLDAMAAALEVSPRGLRLRLGKGQTGP